MSTGYKGAAVAAAILLAALVANGLRAWPEAHPAPVVARESLDGVRGRARLPEADVIDAVSRPQKRTGE